MDNHHTDYSSEEELENEDLSTGLEDLIDMLMQMCAIFLLLLINEQSIRRRRVWWMYPRQVSFWNDLSSNLWLRSGIVGEHNFRNFYRMGADNFEKLLRLVVPHIIQADLSLVVREPIEKVKAVAVVLFRLAHNTKGFICAEMYGMGASTVHKYTRIVVSILAEKLRHDFIRAPSGNRLHNIIRDFESISSVPQVAGAIDGTHIPFKKAPTKKWGPADYWCRHHFFSIVLRAVCDPLLFWDVCCDAPGGAHDTNHFYKSPLFAKLSRRHILQGPTRHLHDRRVQPYLIADSGYPASEFMMVIKKKRLNDPADAIAFSKHLSQARVVIENAFALLKGRWNILSNMTIKMPHAPKVVIACCVLHNFLQMENEDEYFDTLVYLYGADPLNQRIQNEEEKGNC